MFWFLFVFIIIQKNYFFEKLKASKSRNLTPNLHWEEGVLPPNWLLLASNKMRRYISWLVRRNRGRARDSGTPSWIKLFLKSQKKVTKAFKDFKFLFFIVFFFIKNKVKFQSTVKAATKAIYKSLNLFLPKPLVTQLP